MVRHPMHRHAPLYLCCTLIALGLLVGLTSCGYTVVGTSPAQPSGPRTPLQIIPFVNRSREPDLDRLTTAALRHAMVQSPLFVATGDDPAAHQLHGTIQRFRSSPISLDATDTVVQYRIEADLHIRLTEPGTRRVLLEQEFSSAAVYLVSRSTTDRVREDVAAREAAVTRLAQQFTEQCLALLATALL